MQFFEELPSKCPPPEAEDTQWDEVYRLLPDSNPVEDNFKSHAALGRECPPNIDLCRWASCSLNLSIQKIKALKRLPNFKNHKCAAKINIPKGAGLSLLNGNDHIDFWRNVDFDIEKAILEVVDI